VGFGPFLFFAHCVLLYRISGFLGVEEIFPGSLGVFFLGGVYGFPFRFNTPCGRLSFYPIVGAHNKKECKAMILTCYLALLFLN
jgi:hypothetical protein